MSRFLAYLIQKHCFKAASLFNSNLWPCHTVYVLVPDRDEKNTSGQRTFSLSLWAMCLISKLDECQWVFCRCCFTLPPLPAISIALHLFCLVDLNQARPKDSRLGHIVGTGKRPRSLGDRRDSQTVHLICRTREIGAEADHAIARLRVRDGLDDREVLLVDVHDAVAVELAGGGACDAELEGLVCWGGGWGGDAEEAEDGDVDCVDVGAGAVDDEVLVQGREGECWGRGREEGERRWDLAEHAAVEAVLFAFLTLGGLLAFAERVCVQDDMRWDLR